jgi:hypothetical protein
MVRKRKRGRLAFLLAGCLLGIYLGKVFHKGIKVPFVEPDLVWSIGIYTGKSPFNFTAPAGVKNPVLTARDVTDVPAGSLADPFMVFANGEWHLFMEVLNQRSKRGEIGLATSRDGKTWRYRQIVLAEPFHLSYPYVFKFDGSYYLVPETVHSYSVRLYRAEEFPGKWTLAGILVPEPLADPCLFQAGGKWWLFGCRMPPKQASRKDMALEVFFADHLLGPWVRHPRSPVARGPSLARPGGRVINWDGKLVRFAQDDGDWYGRRLHALEITRLTPEDYQEKEIPLEPPLRDSGAGWNARGMHTIDPHLLSDGSWIAVVDGQERVFRWGWK